MGLRHRLDQVGEKWLQDSTQPVSRLPLRGKVGSLLAGAADLLDPVLKRVFDELRGGVAQIHARVAQLPSARDQMSILTALYPIALGDRSQNIEPACSLRTIEFLTRSYEHIWV